MDSGSVLIPIRFVWPHGGRSVYLIGSFTGWTQWPMTPVEGCPTVFQTICSLPPGYYQFKFIVDGEYRHDEHQPYINNNYDTMNTVLLATESNYLPTMVIPQVAHGSNMDVDNEAFQRVVRVSDDAVPETFPRISAADLQLSQHRISTYLSTHTAYELLPQSGKVIALDVDLPVKQAFHILHEQGIPMAPLWASGKGKFVGVLSALDFILIMKELGTHGSNLTEEELETHTISVWKEAKSYLNRQINQCERACPRQLVHVGPDENLKDIATKILQNAVAMVPIIHSTLQDGSYPQLLHLASLSDILKCICRFFQYSLGSLPVLQLPICAIPLGTWVPKIGEPNRRPLAMLRPTASLSTALNLLVQAQVSSIPIVDDNDSLLDVYSRSDITALAKDKIYAHINLEEMTMHQALQLGDEPNSVYALNRQRCQMCLPTDPVHRVMERLSKPGVRRLVIVEAGSKRVRDEIPEFDVVLVPRFLFKFKSLTPAAALPGKSRTSSRGREREMESLTEDEKKALRGSKFAPLPIAPPSKSQPRLAHPGGPMKTNKAAALAKFLGRKMQDPNGLASMDPKLVELAVKNAKDTLTAGETSKSGRIIHHVDSFGDSEESAEEGKEVKITVSKKKKKKNAKNKNKKRKNLDCSTKGKTKKSKKKIKI